MYLSIQERLPPVSDWRGTNWIEQTISVKFPVLVFILGTSTLGLPAGRTTARTSKGITCKMEKVVDEKKSGLTAFTVIVPKGWTNKNTFYWRPDGGYYLEFLSTSGDSQYMVDVVAPVPVLYNNYTGAIPPGSS